MGLLKHVILPIHVALHLYVLYVGFVLGTDHMVAKLAEMLDVPAPSRSKVLTQLTQEATSVDLVLMVNCLAGIFLEGAHYRGMALVLEILYSIAVVISFYAKGVVMVPYLITLIMDGVGVVVHALEPGVFTKDKTKVKKR